jgi:hypothetical protein
MYLDTSASKRASFRATKGALKMNEISERAAIAGYVAMAARSASTRLVDAVDVPSVETYEDAGAVIDEVITQSRAGGLAARLVLGACRRSRCACSP